jgi:hypothetical protein
VASRLAAFMPICSPQMVRTVLPVFMACSAKKNAEADPVCRFKTQANCRPSAIVPKPDASRLRTT